MTMTRATREAAAKRPLKTKKPAERKGSNDITLKAGAMVLAGAAALFPWYVFLNQEKFGVSVAGWEQLRDARGFRQRDSVEVPPMSIARKPSSTEDPADMLFTATVAKTAEDSKGDAGTQQPFPGRSGFRLLHVANGRAMIEDGNGMYIVQTGSILPDNSRLAALTQKNGKWIIVTSTGEVYESAQ
jgi:hypothetical protein